MLRLILAILAIALPWPALAIQVTPMLIEMRTVGAESRANFTVTNTGPVPLPIEFSIEAFELQPAGGRTESDGGDDFLVFPPQRIIPPYERQRFQVQWVGEPELARSRHYLISVKQVPISSGDLEYELQLAFTLRIVVNVSAPGAAPDVQVLDSGLETDEKGQTRVWALFDNRGPGHTALRYGGLSLEASDAAGGSVWRLTPDAEALSSKVGLGLLPGQSRRRYVFPFPLPEEAARQARNARVTLDARQPGR